MTLDEIAYNLLNLVRGGRSNQDEHISLDQIKFNVKHYRAMFIRRDYAKNGFVSRHVEQDLGCVSVTPIDASKCCNLSSDCISIETSSGVIVGGGGGSANITVDVNKIPPKNANASIPFVFCFTIFENQSLLYLIPKVMTNLQ